MRKYIVRFIDGGSFSFNFRDIDFHELREGLICFDNTIINLRNVEYIQKVDEEEES